MGKRWEGLGMKAKKHYVKKEPIIAICRFCDKEYKRTNNQVKSCEDCRLVLSKLNFHSSRGIQQILEGFRIIIIRGEAVWIRPDDYRIKKALPVSPKMLEYIRERLKQFD